MSARRWPVITIGLILLNFVIFLDTHWVMEKQGSQLWQVREHILVLAAMHPQLLLTPEVQEWVADFRKHDPDDWAEMQKPNSEVLDDWDARTRRLDNPAELQGEMDSLASEYSQLLAHRSTNAMPSLRPTQDRLRISLRPSFTAVGGT